MGVLSAFRKKSFAPQLPLDAPDPETAAAICAALHCHLTGSTGEVGPEWAAAVAVALHRRLAAVSGVRSLGAGPEVSGWQLAGRIRIMGERLRAFQRR